VLLADDQSLIRTAFRVMLNATGDIEVVAEAADGPQAVQQAALTAPDVVVMDVRMPGFDGIEATRRITDTTSCRVLVLTTFDLDEYAYEGLRAGASGFLLKDVTPEALYDAIRVVAAGDAVLSPRITRELIDRFAEGRPVSGADPGSSARIAALTSREHEVLELVASGLSNAEIAQRLFLAEATVKTHITRILAKLGLRDRVQAVIYAYEHGLR
jgi:DNA-binding NarL/FixJ family response regulator